MLPRQNRQRYEGEKSTIQQIVSTVCFAETKDYDIISMYTGKRRILFSSKHREEFII